MKFYHLSTATVILVLYNLTTTTANTTNVEDTYIQHFGNDPPEYTIWELARSFNTTEGKSKLKQLCAISHRMGKYGSSPVIMVLLRPRRLVFDNEQYKPRKIDVLVYWVDETTPEQFPYWFLTGGTRKDCVFYLTIDMPKEVFKLKTEVCGVVVT